MHDTTGRKTDRQWKFIDVLRNDQKKKQARQHLRESQTALDKDIRQHYENVLQKDEPINLLQSSPRLASSRKAAKHRKQVPSGPSDDLMVVSDLTAPVEAPPTLRHNSSKQLQESFGELPANLSKNGSLKRV